jgi:hypothetical protein
MRVPLDRKRFRAEPESYLTEYCYAKFGGMYAVHVTDARATQFRMRSPAIEAVWIIMFERGAEMCWRSSSVMSSVPPHEVLKRTNVGARHEGSIA